MRLTVCASLNIRHDLSSSKEPHILQFTLLTNDIAKTMTVKTTEVGGMPGYDGAKKIDGRKRHIIVDTLGLLMAVVVTAACVDDGVGAQKVGAKLRPAAVPRLETIFGDTKYHNHEFSAWLK